jgi:hypothetical protein
MILVLENQMFQVHYLELTLLDKIITEVKDNLMVFAAYSITTDLIIHAIHKP